MAYAFKNCKPFSSTHTEPTSVLEARRSPSPPTMCSSLGNGGSTDTTTTTDVAQLAAATSDVLDPPIPLHPIYLHPTTKLPTTTASVTHTNPPIPLQLFEPQNTEKPQRKALKRQRMMLGKWFCGFEIWGVLADYGKCIDFFYAISGIGFVIQRSSWFFFGLPLH